MTKRLIILVFREYTVFQGTGRLTTYLMEVTLGGTTTHIFLKWGQKISVVEERRSRIYGAEITDFKTVFSGTGIQGVKKRWWDEKLGLLIGLKM